MTHEEIAAITSTEASAGVVEEFLERRGAKIVKSTKRGEYITASLTIKGWEEMLSAEFFRFEHDEEELVRALEYALPPELKDEVQAAFNTVQVRQISPNSG